MSICQICGDIFLSRNKLFTHIRNSHNTLCVNYLEIYQRLNRQIQPIGMFSPYINIKTDVTNKSMCNNLNGSYKMILYTIYEDDSMKIIVKPQGLSTMGEWPCLYRDDSLLLTDELTESTNGNSSSYKKAVPCHRLDKSTGGLVICSKSSMSESIIRKCFRHKLMRKRYRSIAIGKLDIIDCSYGKIDVCVDGKEALTFFQVVSVSYSAIYGHLTTLDLWPVTGRQHQVTRRYANISLFF